MKRRKTHDMLAAFTLIETLSGLCVGAIVALACLALATNLRTSYARITRGADADALFERIYQQLGGDLKAVIAPSKIQITANAESANNNQITFLCYKASGKDDPNYVEGKTFLVRYAVEEKTLASRRYLCLVRYCNDAIKDVTNYFESGVAEFSAEVESCDVIAKDVAAVKFQPLARNDANAWRQLSAAETKDATAVAVELTTYESNYAEKFTRIASPLFRQVEIDRANDKTRRRYYITSNFIIIFDNEPE